MYPVEIESKFAQESTEFMGFMAIVCALWFLDVLPVKLHRAKEFKDYKEIINQGFDLFTTAVPQSLPCCPGLELV